jgi:D-xylose transport system permease protein
MTTEIMQVAEQEEKRRFSILKLLTEYRALPVLMGLLALIVFFSFQSDVFLSSRNLSNVLVQTIVIGTISLGLVFILLQGEIDLSVAAVSGVTSVTMAQLVVNLGASPWLAILGAIASGVAIGAVTGWWVTTFRVPSFVVTLGMGLSLNGLQLFLLPTSGSINLLGTGVELISGTFLTGIWSWMVLVAVFVAVASLSFSRYLRYRAAGLEVSIWKVFVGPTAASLVLGAALIGALNGSQGVPVPVVIFGTLLGLASYVLTETRFGLHVYAAGGNAEAARRAGINVGRVKITAFAIAGGLSAVAGVIAASRILGVSVSSGGGIGGGALLLYAIAATVIGGVSLFGGRGRASSALLGALVMGVVQNGLNLMGVSSDVQWMITGLLLILAVTVDRVVERYAS